MIKKTKCLAFLVSLTVAIAFEGNAFAQSSGGVLYSLLIDISGWSYTHAIEAVDLSTGSHVKTLNLGAGYGLSMAVSPDQTRLYVGRYVEADGWAGSSVDVYDDAGGLIQKIPTNGQVHDLILSPDGTALYATTQVGVHKIDVATNAVVTSYEIVNANALSSISISPDGSKIAITQSESGEVTVVQTSDMTLLFSIPITTQDGSPAQPGDSKFATNDRLLIWDWFNASLYQVDVPTASQLVSQMIVPGGSGEFGILNMLDVDPVTGIAFAQRLVWDSNGTLTGGVAVMNPVSGTSSILEGSDFTFLVPKVSRAHSSLYIGASVYSSDTSKKAALFLYSIPTGEISSGFYTFQSPGLVFDIQIIEPSQDPTVVTPTQASELLLGEVSGEPSLSAPIGQVPTFLSDANTSNDAAACGKLDAFLSQLGAKERSGKLTTTEATELRSQTQAIKLAQGCP